MVDEGKPGVHSRGEVKHTERNDLLLVEVRLQVTQYRKPVLFILSFRL